MIGSGRRSPGRDGKDPGAFGPIAIRPGRFLATGEQIVADGAGKVQVGACMRSVVQEEGTAI